MISLHGHQNVIKSAMLALETFCNKYVLCNIPGI